MAYSDLDTEIVYTGDNSTTIFPINFARTDESFVQAELWDITDPDNPVQLTFANPTDWQIVGDDVVASVAPTTVQQVFIYRSSTPINETDFTEYEFPYATMNITLDKVYQLAQENKAALGRSISNPHYNIASGNGSSATYEDVIFAVEQADQVAQNTSDISTNASAIAANASAIGANGSAIGANASAISTLQGQVALIANEVLVPVNTPSSTYSASLLDIVLVQASDVTIDLPAPSLSGQVKVKMDGIQSNCIVQSASGIDGFGTQYTLQSEYESISLVSDGTQWYII